MALVDTLIASFQAAQDRARAANELRYEQGMDLFDKIIGRYEEGGTFMKGVESQIERGRTKSVAQGMQSLVSSGLSGTTTAAGLGKKFEEEVGTPARMQAQDIAMERLSAAERDKIGFIERREDIGPDYATIAGLAQTIGSRPRGTVTAPSSYSSLDALHAGDRAAAARKRAAADATHARQRAEREATITKATAYREAYSAKSRTPEAVAQSKRRYGAQSYATLQEQRGY